MPWRLNYSAEAVVTLRRMPVNVARTIRGKVERLADNPYAPNNNVRALKGRPGYRLRVGDWRVLYELQDDVLLICVVTIAPRGSAYD